MKTNFTIRTGLFSNELAVSACGTVWAWGYNGCSQLGDNSTTTSVRVRTYGNPDGATVS